MNIVMPKKNGGQENDTIDAAHAASTSARDPVESAWVGANITGTASTRSAVPSLDKLYAKLRLHGLDTWPSEEARSHVQTWLRLHADDELYSDMNYYACCLHGDDWEQQVSENPEATLVEHFPPAELLLVWHHFTDFSSTDLTDVEWQLLLHELQSGPGKFRAEAECRLGIDGIIYRFAKGVPWSQIPPRFGPSEKLYEYYLKNKRTGRFHRALVALCSQPEASRIVAHLVKFS